MYIIRIWHALSTNFNANQFVRENGTGVINCTSSHEAAFIIGKALKDENITTLVAETPTGTLTWDTSRKLTGESIENF